MTFRTPTCRNQQRRVGGLVLCALLLTTACSLLDQGQSLKNEAAPERRPERGQSQIGGDAAGQAQGQHKTVNQPSLAMPRANSLPETTQAEIYSVDAKVHSTTEIEFVPHTGSGKFESYLAMNIPFSPVAELRAALEADLGLVLKHRGEAHITVVTPPEYERLSKYLSIESINSIAHSTIQTIPFRIACIGEVRLEINDETARSFFLVVRSEGVLDLRNRIAQEYRQAGGPAPAFAKTYNPHITIGFTHRDIHLSDGAVKDSETCFAAVQSEG